MPAEELVPRTCSPLLLERQWRINGRDYERTARAWLANLDSRRRLVEQCLSEAGGGRAEGRARQRCAGGVLLSF